MINQKKIVTSNDDTLIQALSSVSYEEANAAIKKFYRMAVGKEEVVFLEMPELIEAIPVPRFGVNGVDSAFVKEGEKKILTQDEVQAVISEGLGIRCPRCGGDTNKTGVCSMCDLGKAGMRVKYSCASCSTVFFSKEEL